MSPGRRLTKGRTKASRRRKKRLEEFSDNRSVKRKNKSQGQAFRQLHPDPQSILKLQRRIGNSAVNRMLSAHIGSHPSVMRAAVSTRLESILLAEPLLTNDDYADWILRAGLLGFVKFAGNAYDDLDSLKKGSKVAGADPSSTEILHGLVLMRNIVTSKIKGWIADGAPATKPTVTFGSFMTWKSSSPRGKAHGAGAAVDIVGMETTKTVDKVIEIIDALPIDASYRFGMPFEGDFFDPKDNIENREQEEAPKGTYSSIKDAVEFKKAGIRNSDWDGTKWVRSKSKGGAAWTKLKSDLLKDRIRKARKEFHAMGHRFMVFPDFPGHLHARREE